MATIKVMAFEPNRPSAMISLPNEGEDIEDFIGGKINMINMQNNIVLTICGDARKKKPNRDLAIVDSLGRHIVDTIAGNFFACRISSEGLCSLSESDIARVKRWEQDGTLTMFRAHS